MPVEPSELWIAYRAFEQAFELLMAVQKTLGDLPEGAQVLEHVHAAARQILEALNKIAGARTPPSQ